MATEAAYMATNHVLVPVRPEFLSSIGFPLLARSVQSFKQQYPTHSLDVIGVFLANVRRIRRDRLARSEYDRTLAATRQFANSEGWNFMEQEIRFSESYLRGSREGTSIANTHRARATVQTEFSRLAREVFQTMGVV